MSGTAQQIALSSTWTLPQASDISGAYEQSYIAAFPGCDPTQPNSFMAVQARTHGIVGFSLYLFQRSLADELMVDRARSWLPRHAAQWGVPQIPAVSAIGNVVFTGVPGDPLPSGIELVDDNGTQFITTVAAVIGAAPVGATAGTVSVPVACEVAGIIGNEAPGTELTVISAIAGLQNQAATVDPNGIAGGADAEAFEAWRARIILRIQKRGAAGDANDYIEWAEANGAAPAPNVIPNWVGPGTVALVFALPPLQASAAVPSPPPDRVVPTVAQVSAMQAAINLVRPVTAQVTVLGATQTALPLTIALANDTVVNRALAEAAARQFIAANAIGGLLDRSELVDAVLQATGCGVEISAPAANVQAAPTQMLTIGTAGFVAYV